MKNLIKLIFISTALSYDNLMADNIDWPKWLKGFIRNLNCDTYYNGSVMYRYYWSDKIYYQLEIPSNNCVFCQVINHKGEFIKWPDNLFSKFSKERSHEKLIWQHNEKVTSKN